VGEIDAIAAQWNTLLTQSPELRRSHGQAAVGTYDAVPWQILVSGGKDTPYEPGRDRVDVAVGAHEASGIALIRSTIRSSRDPLGDVTSAYRRFTGWTSGRPQGDVELRDVAVLDGESFSKVGDPPGKLPMRRMNTTYRSFPSACRQAPPSSTGTSLPAPATTAG